MWVTSISINKIEFLAYRQHFFGKLGKKKCKESSWFWMNSTLIGIGSLAINIKFALLFWIYFLLSGEVKISVRILESRFIFNCHNFTCVKAHQCCSRQNHKTDKFLSLCQHMLLIYICDCQITNDNWYFYGKLNRDIPMKFLWKNVAYVNFTFIKGRIKIGSWFRFKWFV